MTAPDDLAAVIDARLAARRQAAAERLTERKNARAEFARRRRAGLAIRHRRKLDRQENRS